MCGKAVNQLLTVLHNGVEYPINHIQTSRRDFVTNDIPELALITVNRPNNPAYPFIQNESIIKTPDGHEWRIKNEGEVSNYKNVKAPHILMDLTDMPFNELLNGIYTPQALFNIILNGTGFTLDLDTTGLSNVTVRDFGRKNRWKMLKDAAELIQVEFTVLPNRVIRGRKQLSSDRGKQYRYAHNLKNVQKKTDSTDIVTHVIVNYGEDYTLTETFISPTAGNYNRAFYGDIINDERITTSEGALKRAQAEFKDIDLSYELSIAQIGNDVELGETIHTIYEPLNDLSISTRIMKLRDEWNGEEYILTDATVGNYAFKSASDIIRDEIDKANENTNDKIDETKEIINKNVSLRFKETDQKMLDQYTTVTSEYTSAISISARALTAEFNEKVTTVNSKVDAQYTTITAEYNSKITQTAQQIRSEVSTSITTVNNKVDAQFTTITENYNSAITQTAQQIRSEVTAEVTKIGTDIQSVRNDVSSVTQTASQIQATVNSQQATINSQGTRIANAESSITQTASQIQSKVSYTEYTGATITSKINQDPYAVAISASRINLNGAVVVDGSISGATNISVTRDMTIGNQLQLGNNSFATGKGIRFSNGALISGSNYADLTISSNILDLSLISNINWGSNAPAARFG